MDFDVVLFLATIRIFITRFYFCKPRRLFKRNIVFWGKFIHRCAYENQFSIFLSVTQGSILGPRLYNKFSFQFHQHIYLNTMFHDHTLCFFLIHNTPVLSQNIPLDKAKNKTRDKVNVCLGSLQQCVKPSNYALG